MKKISLFLVMIFLGVGVQAQDNGFGVRAGVNIASMTNYNSKVGFHVGGMNRLQLLSDMPLFFEPGLELQFKGGKLTQSGASNTLNLVYVEVPAMIAYRFRINDKWAIQPAVGPFFSFGVSGRIYFGVGYDLSFINLPKNYTKGDPKLRNGSFYISAGYNF